MLESVSEEGAAARGGGGDMASIESGGVVPVENVSGETLPGVSSFSGGCNRCLRDENLSLLFDSFSLKLDLGTWAGIGGSGLARIIRGCSSNEDAPDVAGGGGRVGGGGRGGGRLLTGRRSWNNSRDSSVISETGDLSRLGGLERSRTGGVPTGGVTALVSDIWGCSASIGDSSRGLSKFSRDRVGTMVSSAACNSVSRG